MARQLDEGRGSRFSRCRQEIRVVGVHEAGVVDESVPREECRGLEGQLPVRRAVADRPQAEDLVERRQPAQEPRLLFHRGRVMGALVEKAVMADLVAGIADGAADRRPALGAVARDEEGGSDATTIEHPQQAGDPGSRPVGLVAHDIQPCGGLRVFEQDGALGVDVEGQAGGRPDSARPAKPVRQR